MPNRDVPIVPRLERINAFPIGERIKITEQIEFSFEVVKRSENEWEIVSLSIDEQVGDILSAQVLALKYPAVFTRLIEDEHPPEPRKPKLQPKLAPLDDDFGSEL